MKILSSTLKHLRFIYKIINDNNICNSNKLLKYCIEVMINKISGNSS